ncbi:LOW QUALITY PROTEIN: hypothetical protein MAR_032071 [Mya arenaria]|uniref:Uncharacterized protein n=1 Tax=Mya arenaria TaxID=6604 RepID=A0ABY7F776_MYAAR|nr:LOW QUALITY PROTEIN: hypothetical protein MAR_032071 [Mya arenaria]
MLKFLIFCQLHTIVALTTDVRTSRVTEAYTRAMPLSHSAENVSTVNKYTIKDWGLLAYPPLLAVQKGVEVNAVSRLLDRIRRFVANFHMRTTAAVVLREKIKLLNLSQTLSRFMYSLKFSCDHDITTHEDDFTLSTKIMFVFVPLRTVSTPLCSASMPTTSVKLPLQKKLLQTVTVSTDDN